MICYELDTSYYPTSANWQIRVWSLYLLELVDKYLKIKQIIPSSNTDLITWFVSFNAELNWTRLIQRGFSVETMISLSDWSVLMLTQFGPMNWRPEVWVFMLRKKYWLLQDYIWPSYKTTLRSSTFTTGYGFDHSYQSIMLPEQCFKMAVSSAQNFSVSLNDWFLCLGCESFSQWLFFSDVI